MHKRPKVAIYQVGDRDLLAEVIADVIEHTYAGSLRAGVLATNREIERGGRQRGVSRPGGPAWLPAPTKVDYATIWRALHKQSDRLQPPTFAWLIHFVGPTRRARLKEAVVSPLAQWLLDRHRTWAKGAFARLAGEQSSSVLRTALAGLGARSGRIGVLLGEMLRANPQEMLRFRTRTRSHGEERTQLALLQLAAPFLDAGSPDGLERGWEEMGVAERKRYVRLTLRREELLLDRSPDVQRAQEVASSLRENLSRFAKLGIPPLG
jgi:hypothetical protein